MSDDPNWIPAPAPQPRVPLEPDSLSAFDGLLRGRRSVRRFRSDPVADEIINRVLDAGLWAPSPHGTQPWRFAVLSSLETRSRLADAMAASWQHNLAMDGEPEDVIQARLGGSRRRLLEAPTLILVSLYTQDLDRYPDPERATAERTMAVQSLGACVQNMLLAAYANGIDAGWMCAPLFCPEVVVDALGLDTELVPHALIALGHAAADPKRRPRRSRDTIIVFDDRRQRP